MEDTYLVTDAVITRIWKSDNGEYLAFSQETIPPDGEGPHPNAEDVAVERILLNGYEVFLVRSGHRLYYWTDNEYLYSLILDPSIPEEEGNQIFYSIFPLGN